LEIKQEKRLTDFFKALANPWRLRIIELLSQKEYSVTELCEILKKTESVMSRHLNRLRLGGILEYKDEGAKHRYYINKKNTESILSTARTQLFR